MIFKKDTEVTQPRMADTQPYVDPFTGLRRYTNVAAGAPEELYPAMARYTRVHHTMNIMWETMEHAVMHQTFPMLQHTPIDARLLDTMQSGGIAGMLSVLVDKRAQSKKARHDGSAAACTGAANSIACAEPPPEIEDADRSEQEIEDTDRSRKSNLRMGTFDMSHVYPHYKTLCSGVDLRVRKPVATLALPVKSKCASLAKKVAVPTRPPRPYLKRAPTTPNGFHDRTSRHRLIH